MVIERRLRGTGVLIFKNGNSLPIGSFRIEQSDSGRTFLFCERTPAIAFSSFLEPPIAFQGQTAARQPIQTQAIWGQIISTPRELCFILRNVEVGQETPKGSSHALSLTNFCFPTDNPARVVFPVQWGAATIPVCLSPRRNYQTRLRQLKKTRGIVPTTNLRFRAGDLASNGISNFIRDLCLGLSLVQGRKINWIYHAAFGPHRILQHAVFGETITKTYTAQPLCFNPKSHTGVILPIEAAKDAIAGVKRFRETFDPHNRLINAWLDARTETDYLEARTLKYVVVIEALNALTCHKDKTIARTIEIPNIWKARYNEVITALPPMAAALLTPENWSRWSR